MTELANLHVIWVVDVPVHKKKNCKNDEVNANIKQYSIAIILETQLILPTV